MEVGRPRCSGEWLPVERTGGLPASGRGPRRLEPSACCAASALAISGRSRSSWDASGLREMIPIAHLLAAVAAQRTPCKRHNALCCSCYPPAGAPLPSRPRAPSSLTWSERPVYDRVTSSTFRSGGRHGVMSSSYSITAFVSSHEGRAPVRRAFKTDVLVCRPIGRRLPHRWYWMDVGERTDSPHGRYGMSKSRRARRRRILPAPRGARVADIPAAKKEWTPRRQYWFTQGSCGPESEQVVMRDPSQHDRAHQIDVCPQLAHAPRSVDHDDLTCRPPPPSAAPSSIASTASRGRDRPPRSAPTTASKTPSRAAACRPTTFSPRLPAAYCCRASTCRVRRT